jgi:hypothetical protein
MSSTAWMTLAGEFPHRPRGRRTVCRKGRQTRVRRSLEKNAHYGPGNIICVSVDNF